MRKVFRNAMFFAAIAGSISLTSCRENSQNQDEPAEPMQNEMRQEDNMKGSSHGDMRHTDVETSAEFKDENTARTYNLYVEIKDALVNTNAEEAQKKAQELAEVLEENQAGDELLNAVGKIARVDDVNRQREAFSELTVAMEEILEEGISSGEIYKQFCPMAFEGKGDYWYSNTKDVFNPYYGDRMLKCGRVEQTLN